MRQPRAGYDLTKFEQRKLEHGISILKKQGIVPKSTKIDSMIRFKTFRGPSGGDMSAIDMYNRYDDLISGKGTVARGLSKAERGRLQHLGYQHAPDGGFVVPHAADESVRVVKGQAVTYHPSGISRVLAPTSYRSPGALLYDLEKHPEKYQGLIKNGDKFGFRLYGGSSDSTFRTMDQLARYLKGYKVIIDSMNDTKLQREILRHLEILHTDSSKEWWKRKDENLAKMRKERPIETTKKVRGPRKHRKKKVKK